MEMMAGLCPDHTPFLRLVSGLEEIAGAVAEFEARGLDVVVKP